MLDLILNPAMLPFMVAITIALCLGIIEIINLFLGGITDWFDTLLPEKDISIESGSFSAFDFLCIGRIPFLIWLVTFLFSFGLTGIIFQLLFDLTLLLAVPAVLIISIFPTRYVSLLLQKILPKDETTALYSESFIGLSAVITVGTARIGYPAQAKLKDHHGQTHYIMVEPELDEDFVTGETVVLSEKRDHSFKALKQSTFS